MNGSRHSLVHPAVIHIHSDQKTTKKNNNKNQKNKTRTPNNKEQLLKRPILVLGDSSFSPFVTSLQSGPTGVPKQQAIILVCACAPHHPKPAVWVCYLNEFKSAILEVSQSNWCAILFLDSKLLWIISPSPYK